MIGSLLDIHGLHYQNTLFLEKFMKILEVDFFEYDFTNSKIFLEHEYIDLYLTDGNKHIIIENKIHAPDQEKQIETYIYKILEKYPHLRSDDILVIYLSVNRKKPSKKSMNNLKINNNYILKDDTVITQFKNAHYKNEILTWLDSCLKSTQNIRDLNISILQYKEVVEMISSKYKRKIMSEKDFLLQGDNLKLLTKLENPIKNAKAEIQYLFWIALKIKLEQKGHDFNFVDFEFNETNIERKVKSYYKNSKNNRYFGLQQNIKRIDEKYSLAFYIEINHNIYFGLTLCEDEKRKPISQKHKFVDLLPNDFTKWKETNSLNPNQKWWICWKHPENKLNFRSFNDDILFDLIDENKREKIISDLAKEIDNLFKEIQNALI